MLLALNIINEKYLSSPQRCRTNTYRIIK